MAKQPMPEKLGRYKIVRELGKGAMGVVYEGLDPNINRRVAIKTARRDVMESTGRADEMMERFLREASTAGSLNHPNIITIFDAAEEGDMAYIAMEYLEGGDLYDLMEQRQRFKPEDAVDIAATVCEALAAAHENGIVHRDVKPGNILVQENGQLKVADFGIARIEDSSLTQEGAMIGTPHYMSPEQFMGQVADARSDLFSVGIILYEMLTGEKHFGGEALSTVMHNVIKTPAIEPQELNFSIADCLSKVVLKSLSKKPQERYQNGHAMAEALRESLKPNPDPSITKVACSPAGDANATLIAGQEVVDADATVVAAAPPPGTMEEAAPPTAISASKEDSFEAVPAAVPVVQKKTPIPLYIGAMVVVIVLIGAVMMVLGGDDKNATPDPKASVETPGGTGGEEVAVVMIEVKAHILGVDIMDYDKAVSRIEAAHREGKHPELADFNAKYLPGTVLIRKKGSSDPPLPITVSGGLTPGRGKISRDWESITVLAESTGYEGNEIDYDAPIPKTIWCVMAQ